MNVVKSNTVGDRLSQIRNHSGLTQEKFAERLSVSRVTITQMESGKTKVSPDLMRDLRIHFKVDLNWLITGEGEMFGPYSTMQDIEDRLAELKAEQKRFDEMRPEMNLSPEQMQSLAESLKEYLIKHTPNNPTE